MAQIKYVNFDAPLTSWDQNIRFLGVAVPGRNAGFDRIQRITALTFQLVHIASSTRPNSGIVVEDPSSTIRGPWGMWVTKQGVYVTEDAPVTNTVSGGNFAITINSSGPYSRYDWVYGIDNYVAGTTTPALYGLIAGDSTSSPVGGPPLPTLTDPDHQTLLGYVEVPYGATDLNQCTWVPLPGPGTGNGLAQQNAKLGYPNVFSGIQQFNAAPVVITDPEADNTGVPMAGLWKLPNTGNQFIVQPSATNYQMAGLRIENQTVQNGTRITLRISGLRALQIYSMTMNDPGGVNTGRGYLPIYIPEKYVNHYDQAADINMFDLAYLADGGNGVVVIELEQTSGSWVITNLTYRGITAYATGLPTGSPSIKGSWQYDFQLDDLSSPGTVVLTVVAGANDIDIDSNWALTRLFNNSWGQSVNGTIKIWKSGTYRFDAKVFLTIGNSDTGSSAITYQGPGDMLLQIRRVRPSTPDFMYLLDKKLSYDMIPYFKGQAAAGPAPTSMDVTMKGAYTCELLAGDIINMRLRIIATNPLANYSISSSTQGETCWTGQFFGKDQLIG